MNKLSKTILFLLLTFTFPFLVQAGTGQMPPDNSSEELKKIRNLEGRWTATTDMFGKPNQRVYTEYEVTSSGSAVLERIFPGTPHEMISVYYDDDNGKLAMTHYCMLRNRPQLKLKKSTDDTLVLNVAKISGPKSKDTPSMGDLTLKFKDKNHLEMTCTGKFDGKKKTTTTAYTRVR